jgi:hypothetical protein
LRSERSQQPCQDAEPVGRRREVEQIAQGFEGAGTFRFANVENTLRAVEGILVKLEVVSPAFSGDFDGSAGTVGQVENDISAAIASNAAGRSGAHGGTAAFHQSDGGTQGAVGGEALITLAVLGDEVIPESARAQGPMPAGFTVLDGDPILAGGGAEELLFGHGGEDSLDGGVLDGFEFGHRRFGSGLGVVFRVEVVVSSWVDHKPLLDQASGRKRTTESEI